MGKVNRFTFTVETKPIVVAGLRRWEYIFHTVADSGKKIPSPVSSTVLKDAYDKGLFQFELKKTKTGKEYWRKMPLQKK